MKISGIIPPLVTPFHEDGRLDLVSFERNLEFYAGQDLGGYLVLGSNGEAASLEDDEKLALVRSARRLCPSDRLLLVGTGLESTRATIDLTHRAADLGADAVLVLTPHYFRPQMTSEALRRHYEAVADTAPLPVLLYSVPVYTGLPIPPELCASLAAHPRIAGIKDSSGDLVALSKLLAAAPEGFQVVCGSAPVLYPALCLGAVAGIVAVACCAPAPAATVYRTFERGDHAAARSAQRRLTPLAGAVTAGHGVAGLKAAMDLAGLKGGSVRAPLLPVGPAGRREIAARLAELGVSSAGP